MAPNKIFEVTVGTDNSIRVSGTERGIPKCPVAGKPLDLQRRTAQLLVDMLREGRLKGEQEFRILGENLYTVLFGNEIGEAIRKSLEDPPELIRIELAFEENQDQLNSWPWEYVYCPQEPGKSGSGYFLAHQDSLILTRRLALDIDPTKHLWIEKPPLKVLFVASAPTLRGIEELGPHDVNDTNEKTFSVEYGSVLDELLRLGEKTIKVTALLPDQTRYDDGIVNKGQKATWDNFTALVGIKQPDVIHFLGHGHRDRILFMKEDGSVDPRPESDVAGLFLGKPFVRLVFLQACESALSDPYRAFSGVAQQLAQKGILAVVGMQTKINHTIANQFAKAFYKALADKLTVDAAVQKARTEMSRAPSDSARRLAFGLPVVYLQRFEPLWPPAGPTGTQMGPGISPAGPTSIQTSPELVACPWCSALNKATDNYCGNCAAEVLCKKCNTRADMKRRFCGNCQKPLEQPAEISPDKGGSERKLEGLPSVAPPPKSGDESK